MPDSRPAPTGLQRTTLIVAVALLALGAVLVVVLVGGNLAFGDERPVKQQLADLGALVVMAPDGHKVGTVTLSTIDDSAQVDEALQLVATLDRIQAINLNRMEIGNAELKRLSELTSLASLSLKSTSIDDDGLAHLAKLHRLESLHLNGTALTDDGLEHLAGLDNLKVLDLSDTQVASNFEPIANLPRLEWLVLGNLALDDEALQPLHSSPALRRISLRGTKLPETALDKLRESRPELSIDR